MVDRLGGVLPRIAAGAVLACALPAWGQTCADYGVPVNGYPNTRERALLTLTNACRVSPVDYRNAYLPAAPTILNPLVYPAQPPLQWVLGLNQSARAHSAELSVSPCPFQHNSCNGTLWYVRINGFYTGWT